MATIQFYPKDAHAIMNSLVRQATGQTNITVTDTASFVDAGKKTLETGIENVFNSLAVLIGRTIIDSRPYTGKFQLISKNESDAFDNRVRKISFYARDNQASGAFNTDLYTNLGAGLSDTDGAGSMWEQNPAIPLERYYFSDFTWDKSHTEYVEQVKIAFTDESSFIAFLNGIAVEIQNDIESTIEARNRLVVLDRLAGEYLMTERGNIGSECAVNLTKAFNDEFGTAYSTAEILNEHLTAFLEFYVARVKIDSDFMENRSALYHDPLKTTIDGVNYHVLRHTPKANQRFMYYAPFFTKAKARVLPEIFNPQYLDFKQGEAVDFWQSIENPSEIRVKPALPDGETSENVNLKLVIGMLFDEDAIMTNNKFTGMYSTPLNARHLYTNLWWHFKYGVIQDYTFNAVLYYMSDLSESFTGDGTKTGFVIEGTVNSIVSVTVNGTVVDSEDYTFDADTNTITFNSAPENEAVIVVNYV